MEFNIACGEKLCWINLGSWGEDKIKGKPVVGQSVYGNPFFRWDSFFGFISFIMDYGHMVNLQHQVMWVGELATPISIPPSLICYGSID